MKALLTAFIIGISVKAAPLSWQQANGSRFAAVPVPAEGKTGFTLLPGQATGVVFTNRLSDLSAARNRILENGSGVALGDVDGDGLCDVYLCGLEGPNVLYKNLGNWRFEDITAAAGVACGDDFSTGALLADVDGDGDLDLFVNGLGIGTRFFRNEGAARFVEIPETGLARQFGAMTMTMGDIDADGDLELYVANYRANTFKDAPPGLRPPQTRQVDGKYVVTPEDRYAVVMNKSAAPRVREIGEPDILYVNKGNYRWGPIHWLRGAFLDEEGAPLTQVPRDWGLAAMFRDIDGDNTPDLYVCNDFFYSPDRIWMNQGGRGFRAAPRLAVRNMSMSSMTVDFADINRDGYDDFFVADMLSREHLSRHRQRANVGLMKDVEIPTYDPNFRPEVIRNTLFLNRGDNTYAEIAQFAGVHATEWTWCAAFLDVDLDGYEDLLITNGNDRDILDADTLRETAVAGKSAEQHLKDLQKFPKLEVANLAFRNRRDLTFEEIGAKWGFNLHGVSHGMAFADLDNDGDLDVVVNNLNREAGFYRNESAAPRVAVRLKGAGQNSQGIGAKIKVSGGPVSQSQQIISGGRYLSCDDAMRTFAALSNDLKIEVTWRSGVRSTVEHAKPNHIYVIEETGPLVPAVAEPPGQPWFVEAPLAHAHHDDAFDDFLRQPLLPYKWSNLGPGVTWCDFNNDGWDDLVIPSGKGGSIAVFQNENGSGFRFLPPTPPAVRDQTTIIARNNLLLVGSANYEDGLTAGGCVRRLDVASGKLEDAIAAHASSAGPLALGGNELFVGGRVIGGRWPEAADSKVYRLENDTLQLVATLEKVGMVSGATYADLDGDGLLELILACQWGPVRVFKKSGTQYAEITSKLGLDRFTGLWNSVTAGDFDGDGKLDLIAGNWGLNSAYSLTPTEPLRIYFGDLLGRGADDIIEAEYDRGAVVPSRPLDVLGAAIPPLKEKFVSHRVFGQTKLADAFGAYASQMRELQAAGLATKVFLNRGGTFEPRDLPAEAQLAPVFGISVADFDGDGTEDVFLAQNFFDTQFELSRLDAGRGLLLLNDGAVHFSPIPGQRSGIQIYGQQRGCAVADFNHDGRVDLAVAQNNGPAKLLSNRHARPGIRVILPADAAGAQLRLNSGPVRAVQAGSGYWSQDSFTHVLASKDQPRTLAVRWPDGKEQIIELDQNAREIRVQKP